MSELFQFRDPVSTWTHGLWAFFLLPFIAVLLRLSAHDRAKQAGFAVYGVCLTLCFLDSALFHACGQDWYHFFNLLDHLSIYLLIAGTVTPIALVVLGGPWRIGLLAGIWALAFAGMCMRVFAELPLSVRTGSYLLMGWIGCLTYFQLARRLGHRRLVPMWLGGLFYSVGATLNVLHWPVLLPGYFDAHDLFHLFVMAGSFSHFYFMLVALVACRRVPFVVRNPVPAGLAVPPPVRLAEQSAVN